MPVAVTGASGQLGQTVAALLLAAAVLVQGGHEGRAYDVTGPEAVGPRELASLATELGGRHVEVVDVDEETRVAVSRDGSRPGTPVSRIVDDLRNLRAGLRS